MRLVDLELPDTAATRAAEEVLRRYAGDALVNHAVRSAVFAAAYGRLTGVDYDPELLHVAGLPAPLRADVLAARPRLDLAERFTACFADQAARKPDSAAAAAMRSGLGERIAANPLKG